MYDISNFDISIIYKREDNSYVINKGKYHVPNINEFKRLHEQISDYVKKHPEVLKMEENSLVETFNPQTEEDTQKRYTRLIQRILDVEAYKFGYTGPDERVSGACLSVCSYVDTGVKKFDDEARAFRKWRSAVWAKGYEILDLVKSGKMEVPKESELKELLPKLEIVYS